ncbi:MAG: GatB/YqeY domain-containing protein [Planctomycetes bacterium]|nr:GatB/YqeY domain-containing protein [Planctomycetota bacterium]MCC7397500.1 GatB/YqeY domain-containing protein [Planctomycetota bacterium]
MASYLERLTTDMKAAMKGGDKPRLEVLRMLISDLKKKAIDAKVDNLPDDEEVAVLQKAVKTRADSVAQAKAANRADIAQKEQFEIDVITSYLPQQMSAAEVAAKVREVATAIGYQGGKDTGRFMKEWMARFKGLADGKLVQEALKGLG